MSETDSVVQGEVKPFDVDYDLIAHLNLECHDWNGMDQAALRRAIQAQGEAWQMLVDERCPHLFASRPVFVSDAQMQQMRGVIKAVEAVVGKPEDHAPLGVFYGYDFHLNEQGAHLIEINTNAGGGFLNALLIESQQDDALYGIAPAKTNLMPVFMSMFQREWQRVRGEQPLRSVAIVDEDPKSQYLYPEFLLAQREFERAGLIAHIVDPEQLMRRNDGLYVGEQRIDLIYNRLTDFDLQHQPDLRLAWQQQHVVLTPNPDHYQRYADKHLLERLTDSDTLCAQDIGSEAMAALRAGVPATRRVCGEEAAQWWAERKQWFFKPAYGYGSKGAYRGDKMTKRVFDEVMQADYVAQKLALPDECVLCSDAEAAPRLKFDVRCYVYDGEIQLVAARLYQGQTTNFRTPGGGFALVRQVE